MFWVQIIADFVKVEIVAKIKIPADERLKKQARSDLKREQAIDIWRKKMPLKDIQDHLGFKDRTLCLILDFAKQGEPEKAIKRKEGSSRPRN